MAIDITSHYKPFCCVWRLLMFFASITILTANTYGQALLGRQVTLKAEKQRVSTVLDQIADAGHFHFSYNGQIVPKDSIVTIIKENVTVNSVLSSLFKGRFTYTEMGNYIIINRAMQTLSLINTDVANDDDLYSVSGIIINDKTGERLMNASVYEKQLLVSSLTDEHGYFRLKFKSKTGQSLALTVSKTDYRDTTMMLLSSVTVNSRSYVDLSRKTQSNRVEQTALGRFFISTRQKIQSLNIPDFFARRPFQVSLTPGLSSHGLFGSQVVNKVSLNIAGGYSAGVNGAEVGGLFNIDKNDAKYFQLAGIFNLVGGSMSGLQAAIVHNKTLDTVRGAQVAAFFNQADGLVSGLQLSMLHNGTRKLKGVQIGLVNVADTSEGIGIGLINITRNGFYRVTASANNLTNSNLSLKTGTHQFYSVLSLGGNISANQKLYAFGLGIGHDFMLGQQTYISTEANYQFAYTGAWDDRWAQGKLLLNLPLYRNISLTVGPTYNKYSYTGSQPGYREMFRKDPSYIGRNPVKRFVGWEAGLSFTSAFKFKNKVQAAPSQAWYLGLAATAGIGWDAPLGVVTGFELFTQKDLSNKLAATLSFGGTSFALTRSYANSNVIINGKEWNPKSINKYPFKAGIRLKPSDLLYVSGEAGIAYGTGSPVLIQDGQSNTIGLSSGRSFVYSFSGGFAFKNGLDAGVKFEDYDPTGNLKLFAARVAYRMKLSK